MTVTYLTHLRGYLRGHSSSNLRHLRKKEAPYFSVSTCGREFPIWFPAIPPPPIHVSVSPPLMWAETKDLLLIHRAAVVGHHQQN